MAGTKAEKPRCPWVDTGKPDYVAYHDLEWGVPIHDDRSWFEFLTLESAQAGLSWYTILSRRDNYRRAFADFDPEKVSRFDEKKIQRLLQNPGIIRNRLKVKATVSNARLFLAVAEAYGSFDAYMWNFVDGEPVVNRIESLDAYPTTSSQSHEMSNDLRRRGFKFVGPTICYALMQATGLVNDHSLDCYRREEIIAGYTKEGR